MFHRLGFPIIFFDRSFSGNIADTEFRSSFLRAFSGKSLLMLSWLPVSLVVWNTKVMSHAQTPSSLPGGSFHKSEHMFDKIRERRLVLVVLESKQLFTTTLELWRIFALVLVQVDQLGFHLGAAKICTSVLCVKMEFGLVYSL